MIPQLHDIKNKIYNIFLLEETIKEFPQTYKTLLTEQHCSDGTLQFILRRKLNTLHKEGYIHKCIIPATRFGEVIFYHPNKKYKILIEGGRAGVIIYCFFEFIRDSKYYITFKKYWLLDKCQWLAKDEEKTMFLGNCLRFI